MNAFDSAFRLIQIAEQELQGAVLSGNEEYVKYATEKKMLITEVNKGLSQYSSFIEERKKLRQALKFYAKESNWTKTGFENDKGKVATQALGPDPDKDDLQ